MIDRETDEIIKCRDCEYYHEAHYEEPGEAPYIKHQCKNKYGLNKYTVRPDEDFCSRAKRRKDENSATEAEKTDAFLQLIFDEMAQKCKEYTQKNYRR